MESNIQEKVCSRCQQPKPVGEFYKDSAHKDGRASACKLCVKGAATDWQTANRGKVQSNVWLRKNKITRDEFTALYEAQGRKCADCRTPLSTKVELDKKRRDLICPSCDDRRKAKASVERQLNAPARARVLPTTPPSELVALLKS
jgi:DNA-directed RNA polymerase subunit RPC12/RpoP